MIVDVKKQGTRNCKTELEFSIYKTSVCHLTRIPKNQKHLYFPTNPDNLTSLVRSKISFQSPNKSSVVMANAKRIGYRAVEIEYIDGKMKEMEEK